MPFDGFYCAKNSLVFHEVHTLSWDVKKLCNIYIPLQGTDTYPSLRKGTNISSNILWVGSCLFQEGSENPNCPRHGGRCQWQCGHGGCGTTPSWFGSHLDDDNIGQVWVFLVARKVIVEKCWYVWWQLRHSHSQLNVIGIAWIILDIKIPLVPLPKESNGSCWCLFLFVDIEEETGYNTHARLAVVVVSKASHVLFLGA